MAATETAPKATRPAVSSSPVAKKLFIKPGYKIGAVGAPENFKETLGALLEGATLSETPGTGLDAVIAFVPSSAQVEDVVSRARAAVKPDGLLWLCYKKGGPKAGTDLNRDSLNQAVKALGYQGVAQVALSDDWSAMRFKPAE